MKINVVLSPSNVDELHFSGKTTVVIDVLRASTTIVTALMNGAKEIVPVGSVEFAMKASSNMFGGQTLICGERNAKKIDGFNLGNSPLEYTNDAIGGKSIVFFTTNGTKAIVKAKYSNEVLLASFLNLSAVVKYLLELKKPFEILCAGNNNNFCLEDTVCAGKLISETASLSQNVELSDSGLAAVSIAKTFGKNLKKMFSESEHGNFLIGNGFEEDLKYCAKLNITELIPVFASSVIKTLSRQSQEQQVSGLSTIS
ncbi:MAG: 2-phosphosulfolactate phosphatase [Ignavibacteria bacterium CG_4_8_14_3_um_filter_37_9]|nr:2-phosphosulfolactate phosphatase [Ignavibacteria bacterium]OIO20478.1 MAG: 2-phosphosulfolactate phosphatase [Ignavibacteria bacterium CG1_02_37_35]PIP79133.1 MAG: 2-phosphosulfolactate phosphatase [Ignavibacteria bacterium CG22_combo_CG10-13_8_21_14_all_37_15]PIS44597.1 MAG: 2-phosphosulfolactate phosphatase [Ignavibacteria bacterium CG08_land_8_20_14_0_20_37_9]PIW98988.1 MAG: 2-phosphosulfolactate phosphatase [Ignavibacteria bacterium CG_4_8_14_3_um_filter_37_9]PIX95410.1 MAG: 2-phosphos